MGQRKNGAERNEAKKVAIENLSQSLVNVQEFSVLGNAGGRCVTGSTKCRCGANLYRDSMLLAESSIYLFFMRCRMVYADGWSPQRPAETL